MGEALGVAAGALGSVGVAAGALGPVDVTAGALGTKGVPMEGGVGGSAAEDGEILGPSGPGVFLGIGVGCRLSCTRRFTTSGRFSNTFIRCSAFLSLVSSESTLL